MPQARIVGFARTPQEASRIAAPLDLEIRPVTEEEFPEWATAMGLQFGESVHPDDITLWREVAELDRTLAAFDDGRIVGTATTFSYEMGVPGGRTLPCGGLTGVGVHATHRRRGLLTQLMHGHLEDVRGRGEPLAALYASEAPIYGRFGYGPAVPSWDFEVPRGHSALRQPADELTREIRFLQPDEAIAHFPAIYDAVHSGQPGLMSRTAQRWSNWLGADEERHRDGMSQRFLAVLGDRGYVVYRLKPHWDQGPDGTLQVIELVASDPEAHAALWQFCFGVDLVARIKADLRPADDPLPLLLANPDRLKATAGEHMYVRVADVAAALTGRGYACEGELRIALQDPFWPDNESTWHLEAGPDGATCTRIDATPDLRLSAVELGAAYLGGARFSRLARARRVDEDTPGALARADAMFASDPLPWNAQIF